VTDAIKSYRDSGGNLVSIRVHARRDKVGVRCDGVCRREELNVWRVGIVCALNKVPIVEEQVRIRH